MRETSWSDHIGIVDFWNCTVGNNKYDFFYFNDGSIGYCIEVNNFDDITLQDELKFNFVNNYVNLVLRHIEDFSELSIFQFPFRNRTFFSNFLKNCNSSNETVKQLNAQYIKDLSQDYASFGISKLRTIFFFRVFPRKTMSLKKGKRFKYTKDTWKSINDECVDYYTNSLASLDKVGLHPTPLSYDQSLEIISYMLNPHSYIYDEQCKIDLDLSYRLFSHPEISSSNEENVGSLNTQIAYTNLIPDIKNPYFTYNNDNIFINSIQFVKYPDNFLYDYMKIMSSISCPFFFITNIKFLEQNKKIAELRRKIKSLSNYLSNTKNPSIASNDEFSDKEEQLAILEKEGQKLIDVNQTLILLGSDNEILRNQTNIIINELKSHSIYADSTEGKQENLFLNSFPFKSNQIDGSAAFILKSALGRKPVINRNYPLTTSTNVAGVLTSFFDSNHGCEDPYLIFKDVRTNRPVGLDPFSSSWTTSPNLILTGGTGSGKSVAAAIFILRLLNRKNPVFVMSLDKGGSHRQMYKYLGGISLSIDPRKPETVFNIFDTDNPDIFNPETKDDEGKLNDCVNYILTLAYPSEQSINQEPYNKNLLVNTVRDNYREYIKKTGKPLSMDDPKSFPTMKDYVEFLDKTRVKEYKTDYIKDILRNLKSYINSPLNNFVCCHSPKFNHNQLVSFDLEIIYNDQNLRDILPAEVIKISSYIKNIVNNIRHKHEGSRWIFFCDELWLFMSGNKSFTFIFDMLRSFVKEARKKGGMVINASQDLSDFGNENASQLLLNNSPSFLLGKAHSPAEYDLVCNALNLNDEEKYYYHNCGVKHGRYSQFFMSSGDYRGGIKISLTPTEYAMLTSDPADKDHQVEYFKKKGLDPDKFESIIQYSNDFPRGFYSANNIIGV